MPSTAAAAHLPTPEKRPEISAVADDKMESESTALSQPQELFYDTTPTRGAVWDVDEQEAANYTAIPYLVKYIYDDGEYLDNMEP
jgi:hypothetical protein